MQGNVRWMTRLAILATTTAALIGGARAQSVTGNWTFDDTFEGTVGAPLEVVNGTWRFEDALINGQPARVAHFAAMTGNDKLIVRHGIPGNGGGYYANQFTIIMDVLFPSDTGNPNNTPNGWVALYSTNYDTYNDADWYINRSGGLGIGGDYSDAGNPLRLARDRWHRIALVVDLTEAYSFRSYIDGQLQNWVQSIGAARDGRFALYSTLDPWPWFLLFTEPTGLYTSQGYINNLQVRNYAMSDAEIAALGGPTAGPISIPGVFLSGTLTLENVAPTAPLQAINFNLRPADVSTPNPVAAMVGPDGTFRINVPANMYDLSIRGLRYLGTRLTGIDASSGDVHGLAALLKAGDADYSNVVDVLDLDRLIRGLDASIGTGEYLANFGADFNADGTIDVLDLDILISNFGRNGDD